MITTIKLESETRDRLKKFGNKGKTYNQILNDLMDAVERGRE